MPESPCIDCGEPALHIEEVRWPVCDHCQEVRKWTRILNDIWEGRLKVPVDKDGNIILLNEQGESVL